MPFILRHPKERASPEDQLSLSSLAGEEGGCASPSRRFKAKISCRQPLVQPQSRTGPDAPTPGGEEVATEGRGRQRSRAVRDASGPFPPEASSLSRGWALRTASVLPSQPSETRRRSLPPKRWRGANHDTLARGADVKVGGPPRDPRPAVWPAPRRPAGRPSMESETLQTTAAGYERERERETETSVQR